MILSVLQKTFRESKWKETESGRKLEACSYPSAGRQEKPVFPVWSLPPESLELLGGGVRMNAGAYGGEMKDIVQNVTVLTKRR